MNPILVVGANGTVASELVRLLRARGQRVLAGTSRTPTGPDQVHLDLVRGTGIADAMARADAAFLFAPPGHVDQHALLAPFVDHAARRGLRKVVLMSAMGADADPNAPLRRAELHLERSGLRWNTIRPNWFMQNFHTFWLAGIREQNKILLPVGKAKGSFVDTRDIAAVAAELLLRSDRSDQAFDLTGSEALDHDQVAVLLSQVAGRTITYEDVAPAVMHNRLLAAGLPAPYAEFLLVILGFFKAGYSERITDAVQTVTGRAPIRFAQYAQDHRAHWR